MDSSQSMRRDGTNGGRLLKRENEINTVYESCLNLIDDYRVQRTSKWMQTKRKKEINEKKTISKHLTSLQAHFLISISNESTTFFRNVWNFLQLFGSWFDDTYSFPCRFCSLLKFERNRMWQKMRPATNWSSFHQTWLSSLLTFFWFVLFFNLVYVRVLFFSSAVSSKNFKTNSVCLYGCCFPLLSVR